MEPDIVHEDIVHEEKFHIHRVNKSNITLTELIS